LLMLSYVSNNIIFSHNNLSYTWGFVSVGVYMLEKPFKTFSNI
jgi:hypothetical protein